MSTRTRARKSTHTGGLHEAKQATKRNRPIVPMGTAETVDENERRRQIEAARRIQV